VSGLSCIRVSGVLCVWLVCHVSECVVCRVCGRMLNAAHKLTYHSGPRGSSPTWIKSSADQVRAADVHQVGGSKLVQFCL